jgi:hypothetical protein
MTRRIRAGVALLIAGAGAVVWAYGMTVLEPLTEPLGRAASPQPARRLAAEWAARRGRLGGSLPRVGLSLRSARQLAVGVWVVSVRARSASCF